MISFVTSFVEGDVYTDIGETLIEATARAFARDMSTAPGVVLAVTKASEAGREEIGRYQDGEELIPSDETETARVLFRKPGSA